MNKSCGILIETAEGVPDNFLRIGAVEPLAKEGKEHSEVDGTGSLVHHRLQILVRHLLAFTSE